MRVRRGAATIRRAFAVLVFGGAFCTDVHAAGSTIRLGEVTTKTAGASARVERQFRALLAREIDRITTNTARREEQYVLSASLVRLEARESADASRATCVVSATLRRASGGVLVAMMRGRGTAEDDRGALDDAVSHALEAAVHGAVVRVPDAL